ncbi:cysteine-rich tail protein 1 [Tiliqua scincoides]|uniref:cysteine-rich tail protein 1 n=1 Tax=Tiliqua scincoides TaxID=71010 RepID=UPI0034620C48
MDQGNTIENPYASVTIPRAQLRDGFLKYYLGEDLTPDTVIFNPSTLPTYTASQEKAREASQQEDYGGWAEQKIQTQESWAVPYNPYASLKVPGGGSPEPFHWNSHGPPAPSDSHCCCPCCRKCCPCCAKCCCVIS